VIVVSNTTPLRYLIEIEQEQIIFALYGGCLIPQAVAEELTDQKAPTKIREWMENLPNWITIEEIAVQSAADLRILDPGERAAITLAETRKADLLLIDEKLGKRIAKERGIVTCGTLGIIKYASERNLINFKETIAKLQKTSFRFSSKLLAQISKQS
jgi:predicted nucleic acid-binding protein